MDEWIGMHAALVAAGLGAGFLNVMAGGGSLLTLPVLMLLGLPADVANGTNRLSIVSQSLSGMLGYHRGRALDHRSILRVLVPTSLGSLGGALLASRVPVRALELVLLGAMVATALLVALVPRLFAAQRDSEPRWDRRAAGFLGLFGAGLYGGFVQAGVGFLLLGVLGGVIRYDVVRANALKLVCTLVSARLPWPSSPAQARSTGSWPASSRSIPRSARSSASGSPSGSITACSAGSSSRQCSPAAWPPTCVLDSAERQGGLEVAESDRDRRVIGEVRLDGLAAFQAGAEDELAGFEAGQRGAIPVEDRIADHRRDAGAGRCDADQIERIGGRDAHHLRDGAAHRPAEGAQALDRLGKRVLLADEAGHEAAAAHFAARFHPAERTEEIAPGRKGGLARDQIAEHDAVAGEELARGAVRVGGG
jgi:hypothetical protein